MIIRQQSLERIYITECLPSHTFRSQKIIQLTRIDVDLPFFRIHGELHHRSGPLSPAVEHPPTYVQLYFYDSHAALEHRRLQNLGLNLDTLRLLQAMLQDHHQYVPIYCHAYEILQHYDPDDDVSICLCVTPGYNHDQQQYNLPTADEVAVILPGIDGGYSEFRQRDIILQRQTGALQTISDLHLAYVPLYYSA